MKKAILRVLNMAYPELTRAIDDIYGDLITPSMKVETRAQVEIALRKPDMFRGVFLETLRVRTGNTMPSLHNLYNMGNGIDVVRMGKEKGLPVIVMSEAAQATDPQIIALIEPYADAIFEMPSDPDQVKESMKRFFV